MEYTQDALFYTAEEMVAKVTEALNRSYEDADLRVQRAKVILSDHISESLVETLKTYTESGDLDKTTAQDIYDSMKSKHLWSDASLTTNLYTVSVTLDGSLIAEVSDIEAQDEDEACDTVRDDFFLYNANVSLTFRDGQGNEYEHEVEGVEHEMSDYQDSLDFSAEEQ
jgi:hypothetical protein